MNDYSALINVSTKDKLLIEPRGIKDFLLIQFFRRYISKIIYIALETYAFDLDESVAEASFYKRYK